MIAYKVDDALVLVRLQEYDRDEYAVYRGINYLGYVRVFHDTCAINTQGVWIWSSSFSKALRTLMRFGY